jgi:hypothetical protein
MLLILKIIKIFKKCYHSVVVMWQHMSSVPVMRTVWRRESKLESKCTVKRWNLQVPINFEEILNNAIGSTQFSTYIFCYQKLGCYWNLYVVIFEGFLKQKHVLPRVLRLCRRITDGDHLRWKYVVLENNSKNVL